MARLQSTLTPSSIFLTAMISITDQPGDLCLMPFMDIDSSIRYVNYKYDLANLQRLTGIQSGDEGKYYVENMQVGFKVKTGDPEKDKYYNTFYFTTGYKITMNLTETCLVTASISRDPHTIKPIVRKFIVNKDGSFIKIENPTDLFTVIGTPCFVLDGNLNFLFSEDPVEIRKLVGVPQQIELQVNDISTTSA